MKLKLSQEHPQNTLAGRRSKFSPFNLWPNWDDSDTTSNSFPPLFKHIQTYLDYIEESRNNIDQYCILVGDLPGTFFAELQGVFWDYQLISTIVTHIYIYRYI